MKYILLTILLSFSCSSCSRDKVVETSSGKAKGNQVEQSESVSAVERGGSLSILFEGIPPKDSYQLNGVYVVTQERELKMPYLKERLNFTGCTLEEIERKIECAYVDKNIYKSLKIRVQIVVGRDSVVIIPKFITMSGFVENPGPIEYKAGITLVEALSNSGVINREENYIVDLLRNGRSYRLDIRKQKYQDLKLYPHDQVSVPRRIIRGK